MLGVCLSRQRSLSSSSSECEPEPDWYWIYSSESDKEWRKQHPEKYSFENKVRSAKRRNLPTPLKVQKTEWLKSVDPKIMLKEERRERRVKEEQQDELDDEYDEEMTLYLKERLAAYHAKEPQSNPTTPTKDGKLKSTAPPKTPEERQNEDVSP